MREWFSERRRRSGAATSSGTTDPPEVAHALDFFIWSALDDLFSHIETERRASLDQIALIVQKERKTTLDETSAAIDAQRKARLLNRMLHRIEQLGYNVRLEPAAAPAS